MCTAATGARGTKGGHQTGFHNFSRLLINKLARMPPTLLQGEERTKRKVMKRVGMFVSVLTDFATAYNKLSRVLVERR